MDPKKTFDETQKSPELLVGSGGRPSVQNLENH
jgi:hypothetical protein